MKHCHIDPSIWNEVEIRPEPSTSHHLVDVLRVSSGEMISVFDGKGRVASARVVLEGGRIIVLKVVETSTAAKPAVRISLIQALPKGTRMDLIVEKATELGAAAVWPVVTERVVLRLDEDKKQERRDRWHRIAIGAAEQSGVSWIPEVQGVSDLSSALTSFSDIDLFLVGSLGPGARPLRDVMAATGAKNPRTAAILIGPEGDLTPLEVKMAVDAGAVPVSFGPNVFRVETAAIFALSVLAYELAGMRGAGSVSGAGP